MQLQEIITRMSAKIEARLAKLLAPGGAAPVSKRKVRGLLVDYIEAAKRQIIKIRSIAAETQKLEKAMAEDDLLVEELHKSSSPLAKNENSLLKLSNELQLAEKKVRLEALKMEDEFEKQKAQLSSEFKTRLEAVSVRVEAMQTERSQLLAEEEALKGDIGVLMSKYDAEERKEKKALAALATEDVVATGSSSSGEEYEERLRELREHGDMAYFDYSHRAAAIIEETNIYSALVTRQAAAFTELQSQVQFKNDELRMQQGEMKALMDAVNEEERRKKALEFVASEKALMVEQARAAKASSESALETIRVKRGRLQQLAATVI